MAALVACQPELSLCQLHVGLFGLVSSVGLALTTVTEFSGPYRAEPSRAEVDRGLVTSVGRVPGGPVTRSGRPAATEMT